MSEDTETSKPHQPHQPSQEKKLQNKLRMILLIVLTMITKIGGCISEELTEVDNNKQNLYRLNPTSLDQSPGTIFHVHATRTQNFICQECMCTP